MLQSDHHLPPLATSGQTGRDRERQRRRKKRLSREFEDHNESLESPSSIPERIPLHDMGDVDKVNGSAEGSSGLTHGGERSSRSRERGRRPRRRSRTENGDIYNDGNDMQMHTLDLPEKKRHKRPMGSRHAPRSASAEVLHRMEEEDHMADGENMSPTRRRSRRRRGHGSKDFVDDELDDYGGDGGLAPPEHPKRPRPRKHKTKRMTRHQNGTSGEEENYNADMDGEVSMVDTFKLDKEDIVTDDHVIPPPNSTISQTLPSQPLDVLFIQNRDGHGFRSERKARINQLEEDRRNASPIDVDREKTTAEFAVSVHRAFRSFALFCHGLLAGFALCQCIFVYSLSGHTGGNKVFLEYYYKLAQPVQSLYYMLFAICTVSVFDRYDMANPRSGFFHGLLTRPSRILSISGNYSLFHFLIHFATILLTKLADMGVSRNFWRWTQSFLSNRTLQVKLPGVTSRIGHVVAGVPQGGVLSPTLFNVHINDIEVGIQGDSQITTCKYADDCTMYQLVPVDTETHMHHAMHHLESWATENKMELNAKKTKEMWISFKKSGNQPPPLRINNVELERVEEFKLLGVIVQDDLKWNSHISYIVSKASKRIHLVRECRKAHLPVEVGLTTYTTKIRTLLDYACSIWGGLPQYLAMELQTVQDRCLRILALPKDTLEPLDKRRDEFTKKDIERIIKNKNLNHLLQQSTKVNHSYSLRRKNTHQVHVPMSKTKRHKQSFVPRALGLLNGN